MIEIREEHPEDVGAIRNVNKRAFGQEQEGNIVDALRSNGAALLSMVATLNGRVVGHVMYSPISVGDVTGAALGPMAVLPEHQRLGIDSGPGEDERRFGVGQIPAGIFIRGMNSGTFSASSVLLSALKQ